MKIRTENIGMATALKQLRAAANNLSKFAADTGDGSALKASQVANMLANALQTGPAYEVEGVAREFDLVRKEVVDGHSGEEAYGPGSSVTDGCG
jgi:hypothetical protein